MINETRITVTTLARFRAKIEGIGFVANTEMPWVFTCPGVTLTIGPYVGTITLSDPLPRDRRMIHTEEQLHRFLDDQTLPAR